MVPVVITCLSEIEDILLEREKEIDLPCMRNEAQVSHTAIAIATTSLFLFQMAMLAGSGIVSTHG